MHRRRHTQPPRQPGLEFAPAKEAGGERVRVGPAAGELVEKLPVTALGRAEVGEEERDFLVFQNLQEPGEALAAPRLDERPEEEAVDFRPGVAAGNDPVSQTLNPGVLPPTAERPATLPQNRDHPPEVLHLSAASAATRSTSSTSSG